MSDVVIDNGEYMADYVRRELAGVPDLVARMLERGARIVLAPCRPLSRESADAEIQRNIDKLDVSAIALPIFIVVIYLSDRGIQPRPFEVQPARGIFLGAIGLGEGGALFLGADGRRLPAPDAVARLAELVR